MLTPRHSKTKTFRSISLIGCVSAHSTTVSEVARIVNCSSVGQWGDEEYPEYVTDTGVVAVHSKSGFDFEDQDWTVVRSKTRVKPSKDRT